MNERIRELKEQAMEWVPNMADPDTKIRLLNAEKFAELIVKECAKYLQDNSGYGECNDAWHPEPEDMLKHFGVEQ